MTGVNPLQRHYNMTDGKNQVLEVGTELSDGKRPWKQHKIANGLLAVLYENIDPKKTERLRNCANVLCFAHTPEGLRLRAADFCRVRLCPMCTWRRSLKTFGQVKRVMEHVKPQGFAYIFVTLTVANCSGKELKTTIDAMMKSWNRFLLNPRIKAACKGWFRSLEVTHNLDTSSKDYDTYHPHFHILMAVKPSYFKSRYYLAQAEIADIWQAAARLDYSPIVDVRRVKGNEAKAVAEAAKYAVKVTDYIILDDLILAEETVLILDKALDKRRFVAFGGALKAAHKELQLDDESTGDLVHTGDEADTAAEDEVKVYYSWRDGYAQYRNTTTDKLISDGRKGRGK